jgi:hypothetical protein
VLYTQITYSSRLRSFCFKRTCGRANLQCWIVEQAEYSTSSFDDSLTCSFQNNTERLISNNRFGCKPKFFSTWGHRRNRIPQHNDTSASTCPQWLTSFPFEWDKVLDFYFSHRRDRFQRIMRKRRARTAHRLIEVSRVLLQTGFRLQYLFHHGPAPSHGAARACTSRVQGTREQVGQSKLVIAGYSIQRENGGASERHVLYPSTDCAERWRKRSSVMERPTKVEIRWKYGNT